MFNSFLNNIPPVVKNLLAINLILWLAAIALPGLLRSWGINIDLNDVLGMHYWASEKFNPAQLVTYAFMHHDFYHVFFNMFAVYMFGSALEMFWGPRKFLFYYIVTAIGAGVVQQLFWTFEYSEIVFALDTAISENNSKYILPFEGELLRYLRITGLQYFDSLHIIELKKMFLNALITIGASGSVFGLLLAFGWLFPETRLMMLFIPVPIKARVFVLIYGVAELFLGVANFTGDNVAHFAHLGGMLFGWLLIFIWKKRP